MIAEVDDNIGCVTAQIGLNGFERAEVSVDVGDDCDSHGFSERELLAAHHVFAQIVGAVFELSEFA